MLGYIYIFYALLKGRFFLFINLISFYYSLGRESWNRHGLEICAHVIIALQRNLCSTFNFPFTILQQICPFHSSARQGSDYSYRVLTYLTLGLSEGAGSSDWSDCYIPWCAWRFQSNRCDFLPARNIGNNHGSASKWPMRQTSTHGAYTFTGGSTEFTLSFDFFRLVVVVWYVSSPTLSIIRRRCLSLQNRLQSYL